MDLCCGTIPARSPDEQQPIEGAFSPAAFGSPTLTYAGEVAKAQALFERVVAVATIWLAGRGIHSGVGRQTGNFPQALTHIALINTAA